MFAYVEHDFSMFLITCGVIKGNSYKFLGAEIDTSVDFINFLEF